ncbi:MAG: hypothetical protein AAFY71_04145 [Bacteroidota bacterium]
MDKESFLQQLRQHLSDGNISATLKDLQSLFLQTPLLNQSLMKMPEFSKIVQQVQGGLISFESKGLENRVNIESLHPLLDQIENLSCEPELEEEMKEAMDILASRNILKKKAPYPGSSSEEVIETPVFPVPEDNKRLKVFMAVIISLFVAAIVFGLFRYQSLKKAEKATTEQLQND